MVENLRKMQELRAQIQAQLKLADHLKKLGEAGELDEAAQAELDAIQKKLGKYKGKYGKDIGIDELEWVGPTFFIQQSSMVVLFSG